MVSADGLLAFMVAKSSYVVGPNIFCISTTMSTFLVNPSCQPRGASDRDVNWPSYSVCFIVWYLFHSRCPLDSVGINICQ